MPYYFISSSATPTHPDASKVKNSKESNSVNYFSTCHACVLSHLPTVSNPFATL